MSFLNQLKSQASALQSEQSAQNQQTEANLQLTEGAAKTAWVYLGELVKQLNVIGPDGPKLSLDGKNHWPAMKLVDFRVDSRKKRLHDKEVYDYIAMGWRVVPRDGAPMAASAMADFLPDLQRIESRLAAGGVKHERASVRHPEKKSVHVIRFDYSTETRGSVTITANHDEGRLAFRLVGLRGFEVVNTSYAVAQIQSPLLDELAKLIVGQPSSFV